MINPNWSRELAIVLQSEYFVKHMGERIALAEAADSVVSADALPLALKASYLAGYSRLPKLAQERVRHFQSAVKAE
jgi:hypothetical protein